MVAGTAGRAQFRLEQRRRHGERRLREVPAVAGAHSGLWNGAAEASGESASTVGGKRDRYRVDGAGRGAGGAWRPVLSLPGLGRRLWLASEPGRVANRGR